MDDNDKLKTRIAVVIASSGLWVPSLGEYTYQVKQNNILWNNGERAGEKTNDFKKTK
jgi:hypothetical protein